MVVVLSVLYNNVSSLFCPAKLQLMIAGTERLRGKVTAAKTGFSFPACLRLQRVVVIAFNKVRRILIKNFNFIALAPDLN